MSVLRLHAGDDGPLWRALFAEHAPDIACSTWPEPVDPAAVAWVACWNPPAGFFAELSNLRAVFALGAGVERLLARDDLAPHVPIVRLLDAGMAEQMVEYALLGVLGWQRRLPDYRVQQAHAQWHKFPPMARVDTRVGVLGLGRMGGAVAQALPGLGYSCSGWSRTPRMLDRVRCLHGTEGLDALLETSDVLINTLPSTAGTRGLLDRARLARLPRGAMLVNASRGDQLDAVALVDLLDAGHLSGALLDVFAVEPLPADSPLWSHPRITITPHVAATTLPAPSAAQIVANLRRSLAGEPLQGVVDRARGY